jgi:hypothetical protein
VSSAPSALVVSTDALLAALLGAAVETLGYAAAFPAAGEPPRLALGRLRPALVLVDCGADSCADDLLGPATMVGAGLVLFGDAAATARRRDLAARHGAALLTLPTTSREIAATIESVLRR